MKVRVLRWALEDLAAGRRFYDQQVEGVGSYFFDSLFSEIDSLVLHGGVIASISGSIGYSRIGSPSRSTIASFPAKWWSSVS